MTSSIAHLPPSQLQLAAPASEIRYWIDAGKDETEERVELPKDDEEVEELLQLPLAAVLERTRELDLEGMQKRTLELSASLSTLNAKLRSARDKKPETSKVGALQAELCAKEGQLKSVRERHARDLAMLRRQLKANSEALNRRIAQTRQDILVKEREKDELMGAQAHAAQIAFEQNAHMQEDEEIWQ
ncbi:unnamed protein product [Amoebophrya sp. A25]|nr:unnamed protein product [Amoebophrya sp. A25]|eukprot:GSA25T00006235001.1